MADVGVKLPPFERLTLAMDFQSLVNNIVLQESQHQPTSTAIQTYASPYSYRNTDTQLWCNWDYNRGLVYSPHRKRILTKDTTGALKLWLRRHKKNPYPSKAEKIMLAILSKMTLTQVSTWFANARRRLKKDYPDEDFQEMAVQFQNCSDLYPSPDMICAHSVDV